MTSQARCEIYYSVAGEPFGLHELEASHIEHTRTVINIYTREEEEVPNRTAIQQLKDVITELSVPDPIKKGQFFNSESHCLFLNEAGQVLQIEGKYLFPITMMRDGNDHERLHIKFEQQYLPGKHTWKDIAG